MNTSKIKIYIMWIGQVLGLFFCLLYILWLCYNIFMAKFYYNQKKMYENKDIKLGEKFYFKSGLTNNCTNEYIKIIPEFKFSYMETETKFTSISQAFKYFRDYLKRPCVEMGSGYGNFENEEGFSFNIFYNIAKVKNDEQILELKNKKTK